jgi:hypothetical protein
MVEYFTVSSRASMLPSVLMTIFFNTDIHHKYNHPENLLNVLLLRNL